MRGLNFFLHTFLFVIKTKWDLWQSDYNHCRVKMVVLNQSEAEDIPFSYIEFVQLQVAVTIAAEIPI